MISFIVLLAVAFAAFLLVVFEAVAWDGPWLASLILNGVLLGAVAFARFAWFVTTPERTPSSKETK